MPFGTQPNLVCATSGEGIEYDDEQDAAVVELNFEDLPEADFDYLDQQNISTILAEPSMPDISIFSTTRHVDFDDFRLNAGKQYGLLYAVAYSTSSCFYLKFKPDRTCTMCVGTLKSSDLSIVATKQISVTANKTYTVKYELNKGDSWCAMIFNNTSYTMNFLMFR